MAITLAELLSFDALLAAEPQVLCGSGSLGRVVRWVHSSEIYEIAPLLAGGELLLTAGLGLAGADAGARRHYVRELATRGVAGLALELGRTFSVIPPELVEEAKLHSFPLIVLRSGVPFVRVTEMANTAIIDYSGYKLRMGDSVTRALNEALIAGAGIGRLLVVAASVTKSPLVLVSSADALIAVQGVDDESAAWAVVEAPAAEVAVTLHDEPWGRLVAGAGSPLPADDLLTSLERVATALTIAVLRLGTPPSQRDRQAAALLADLLDTDAHSESDLAQRATVAGFHPPPGRQLIGVVVEAAEAAAGYAIIDGAARILGVPALRGRVGRLMFAILAAQAIGSDSVGSVRQAIRESARRTGAAQVRVSVGLPVAPGSSLSDLGQSLREARTLSALIPSRLGERTPTLIVDARTRLLEVMLSDRTDAQLTNLAHRVLGDLIAWDTQHRSGLVHTLEVHLRNGASATRTSKALSIGRQATYQRLERIEAVLGYSLASADHTAALLIATCAHRMAEL